MRILALALSPFLLGSLGWPQNAAADQSPLVLKSTTRLVEVNVIVQGKGNEPVAGLKKEDFTVTDNGKAVQIASFAQNGNTLLPQTSRALPANTFTNQLSDRPGAPASITVILLDWLNTKWTDQVYARQQVVKFLQQIQPEDHIGIYALGSSLRVLHDYTADSTELLKRISLNSKDVPNLAKGEPAAMDPQALQLDAWLRGRGATGAERDFWTMNRVQSTCRALEFIANHLSRVPGRKNIIWVSGGFPLNIGYDSMAAWRDPSRMQMTFSDDIDRTVKALNNADVAVYPVDARGLMVDPRFSAENGRINVRQNSLRPPVGVKNQETMQELASRTGGKAFYNSNDIHGAIRQAVSDSTVTYTLGFYPTDAKFDGKFHTLKVHVNHSGAKVRYRKGYFDAADQPLNLEERKVELRNAVFSPLDATELALTVQVNPATAKPGLDVVVHVAPQGVTLQPQEDRWNGGLDILLVQKDGQGRQYNGREDNLTMRLQQANYEKVTREGVAYHQVVERAAKASELKIVVRDMASGSMGSVTVPLGQVRN